MNIYFSTIIYSRTITDTPADPGAIRSPYHITRARRAKTDTNRQERMT